MMMEAIRHEHRRQIRIGKKTLSDHLFIRVRGIVPTDVVVVSLAITSSLDTGNRKYKLSPPFELGDWQCVFSGCTKFTALINLDK